MKTYVKPKIYIESFALSESIATACSADEGYVIRGLQEPPACYVETNLIYPGTKIYVDGDVCNMEDGAEGFCITLSTDKIPILTGSV